jgi:hypothetical protein
MVKLTFILFITAFFAKFAHLQILYIMAIITFFIKLTFILQLNTNYIIIV